MKPIEATFRGAGGTRVFYRVWRAARPAGAILLVHGMGEHSGRYQHVAEFLVQRGLVVYALDQRGHGLTAGEKGTVGSFGEFLDDLAAFHALAIHEQPGLPLVLFGHSMGGLIAIAYLLERPLPPDGLILSGPAIVPIFDPGDRTIDPSRLSRDPRAWRAYLEDPLVLRERVQEGLYVALAHGLGLLVGRAAEITVPVLLIHGEADVLCSAQGARAYVEASASQDVTVLVYAEGRHEMLNEINRDEVLEDLWAWLQPRLHG
ncbi:MAG: alpha/beta hydrolase [Deltaproteobacteria bacterium]|nr:alpha/beta hydrolase [Deltaproteobacteria bacterium]